MDLGVENDFVLLAAISIPYQIVGSPWSYDICATDVFGFTLKNRNVAMKNSGTKKMARTVAESMPPMVPVPIAF